MGKPTSLISRARAALANALTPAQPTTLSIILPHTRQRASNTSGIPFDGGSSSRRALGWNPTRLGPTTSIYTSWDRLLARSRDAVRNDPWATSAIDNFESQVISTGIRPRWKIKNKAKRQQVELEFSRWARKCDASGQSSFWGLQALAAREIFEGGEVFTRLLIRPASFKMRIPLQLQLIESEQLPLWRNSLTGGAGAAGPGVPEGNTLRTGIEFDSYERRTAYHFYKAHPGETMFYPLDGLSYMRVPAEFVVHTYRPLRAGQLRGVPHLTSVLTLLYELEQYTDAELVRKKIQAMWAAFIKKTAPDIDVIPTTDTDPANNATIPTDPGTANARIEAGTINELLPGEDIVFPNLPVDSDFSSFMRVEGHRFAAAIGATYEQITGDLQGVTYSSIRAGLLDFRRKCEMLQHHIFVHQWCQPIAEAWLKEAVLNGVIDLPGYAEDPDQYTDILWTPSGWDWVDPLKDVQADIFAVRAGFTTRAHVVAQRGQDVTVLDEEWVQDRDRAHDMQLVYDSDPSQVLTKGAKNPTLDADGNPISVPGAPVNDTNAPSSQPDNQPKPSPGTPVKKAKQRPLLQ